MATSSLSLDLRTERERESVRSRVATSSLLLGSLCVMLKGSPISEPWLLLCYLEAEPDFQTWPLFCYAEDPDVQT